MRRRFPFKPVAGIVVLVLVASAVIAGWGALVSKPAMRASQARHELLCALPHWVVWAWQRPEHLEFIDPREVALAAMVATIDLCGSRVVVEPRLNPVFVPPGTREIGVIHIEADRCGPPDLSVQQRRSAVAGIARLASRRTFSALQVDFDATRSQREFYRLLLTELRQRLPDSLPLTITAIASWCMYDNWLDTLPVDEAVPMLFRMGEDGARIRAEIANGRDFHPRACRLSVGLATDEPVDFGHRPRRRYFFPRQPWTAARLAAAMKGSSQ